MVLVSGVVILSPRRVVSLPRRVVALSTLRKLGGSCSKYRVRSVAVHSGFGGHRAFTGEWGLPAGEAPELTLVPSQNRRVSAPSTLQKRAIRNRVGPH